MSSKWKVAVIKPKGGARVKHKGKGHDPTGKKKELGSKKNFNGSLKQIGKRKNNGTLQSSKSKASFSDQGTSASSKRRKDQARKKRSLA